MSDSPITDRMLAPTPVPRPRAIVYREANLGEIDGKTANGLVRHSERYEIISVIDQTKAGRDAGEVLDGTPNGILCRRDLGRSTAVLRGSRRKPSFSSTRRRSDRVETQADTCSRQAAITSSSRPAPRSRPVARSDSNRATQRSSER